MALKPQTVLRRFVAITLATVVFQPMLSFQQIIIYENKIQTSYPFPKLKYMIDQVLPQIEGGILHYSIICYNNFSAENPHDSSIFQTRILDFSAPIFPLINPFEWPNPNTVYGSLAELPRNIFSFPCRFQGKELPKIFIPERGHSLKLGMSIINNIKHSALLCNINQPSLTSLSCIANLVAFTGRLGFTLLYPFIDFECRFQLNDCLLHHYITNENLFDLGSHLNRNESYFFVVSQSGLLIVQNFTLTLQERQYYIFNESKAGFKFGGLEPNKK